MELNSFSVDKLNGIYDYHIPIKDNKLVLVGENGTGKSTILSMLNCILSRQWYKLIDYDFKSISIEIDRKVHLINQKDLRVLKNKRNKWPEMFKARDHVKNLIERKGLDIEDIYINSSLKNEILIELSDYTSFGIGPKSFDDILYDLENPAETKLAGSRIFLLDKTIRDAVNFSIIFLPTYRRIERELSSIFPNFERKIYRGNDQSIRGERSNEYQVELVEFGMKDVRKIIDSALNKLEELFRIGMKNLMADYLQDIFMHRHETFDYSYLSNMNTNELERMLLRIDTETLSSDIKETIRSNIFRLSQRDSINLSESDKVMSYFVSKLNEFDFEQSKHEDKIKKFIQTCNNYLVGKKLIFNSIGFEINIFHINSKNEILTKKDIPFEALSSGEKQIVSLFSHLYLSERDEFMIIIDEPELSLSVKWQRTFLEDIVDSGNCRGLFAVTHSPFVYDNSLDQYARSIGEFMESSK